MESMDHDQAMALLGLSGPVEPDDIEAKYAERRRLLERRWVTSHSEAEKRVLEAQMRELDAARDAALTQGAITTVPAGSRLDFKPGTVLADRYVVRGRLGFGPRGAVFRALDLTWGKDVAVKVIAPQLLLVPGQAKRVIDTVQPVIGFAHSGIVNVYAAVKAGGHTLIVMELVEGRTLAQRDVPLAWSQPKSAPEILRLLDQISAALSYAEKKTPHLNLTPHNVMLTNGQTAKLSDFTLNAALPVLAGAAATQAEDHSFIAPEVHAALRADTSDLSGVGAQADQYSLAALAYFVATGAAPVTGRKSLGAMRSDLPAHFVAAVERALALAPEARFATTQDFLAAAASPARRVKNIPARIVAATAVLGFIAAVALGLQSANETLLGPVAEWLPGGQARASARVQAQGLQARVTELRATLTNAQSAMQRRAMDARMTLSTVEQLSAAPDPTQTAVSLDDARRSAEMMRALSDMVTPRVFNGPDVLNAYNLMGLSEEHIQRGRYEEAIAVLANVETVLSAKLRDLRQAELLIEQQYGMALPPLAVNTNDADLAADLKRKWLAMTEQRRHFAEDIESGLTLVPAGAFAMGDTVGNGAKSELPVRSVKVDAFKIGRYEVTRGEYNACVADGACAPERKLPFQSVGDDLPVTGVSWLDAQKYVDWLRIKTGEDYRLPSEAEWEYAARAGAVGAYAWGEQVGRNAANCLDCGSAWDGAGPAPVGSFKANAFGLFDMTGNAWEWTADCWYRDYTSAPDTAVARDGGTACEKRVLRGGSWDNAAWLARNSYRAFAPANTKHELYGFRIAKSVE
ncbi:MAG: SUMF1/EgtB/PvdO family nonheme iron enzyme [Rhodospirillaceae bacterium]|nr:SUMF1/EgtB/PvdO family nonheme iron enzyme [Rhodospirillaceae bacterium]